MKFTRAAIAILIGLPMAVFAAPAPIDRTDSAVQARDVNQFGDGAPQVLVAKGVERRASPPKKVIKKKPGTNQLRPPTPPTPPQRPAAPVYELGRPQRPASPPRPPSTPSRPGTGSSSGSVKKTSKWRLFKGQGSNPNLGKLKPGPSNPNKLKFTGTSPGSASKIPAAKPPSPPSRPTTPRKTLDNIKKFWFGKGKGKKPQ